MNDDCNTLVSEIQPEAVREQLGRMLAHPVFKASRRCQILLPYLVEYALRGETSHPKERTLGVEVFGRASDYDTNDDPVVRNTSSDIRKRIAQYYHDPQHEMELRIDLPLGSYLLEFHLPELQAIDPPLRKYGRRYLVILGMAILALCIFGFLWMRMPTSLDRFWRPVLDRSESLSVCIPVSSPRMAQNALPAVAETLGMPSVGLTDNTALLQIAHFLDFKNARYSVKLLSFSPSNASSPSEASLKPSLAELRKSPIIFIGNSDWSMRLLAPLRYHIRTDNAAGIFWIEDNKNPTMKDWKGTIGLPYEDYSQDYAIISRVFDPVTGQTVVAVSGLGLHGTAAAAEFVTNPAYLSLVASGNSHEWKKKNLQIVISAKIAGESWSPPYILAKYFW